MKTSSKSADVCHVRRCRQAPAFGYELNDFRYRVCAGCWIRHCDDEDSFDLRAEGILLVPKEEIR